MRFKRTDQLRRHKEDVHRIDATWHTCDQPNCSARFTRLCNLQHHKMNVHGMGVIWHFCDHPGCSRRFKTNSKLKSHKADVHRIGVKWHVCDQPECSARFSRLRNLKRHAREIHGVELNAKRRICNMPESPAESNEMHQSNEHETRCACSQPGCATQCWESGTSKRQRGYSPDGL